MKIRSSIALAAMLSALAACGGGGSDTTAPDPAGSVPDEASASAAGMAQWLGQVATTTPEDREPLDAARFAPPQPDDTEPVALR